MGSESSADFCSSSGWFTQEHQRHDAEVHASFNDFGDGCSDT